MTADGRGRWRTVVLIALGVLVAAVVVVLVTPRGTAGALDPDSPTPDGSRALAQVLADQGVETTSTRRIADVVDGPAAGGDAAVLVIGADLLTPELLDDLDADLGGTDLVLLAPGSRLLEDLGLELVAAGAERGEDPAAAGCDLPAARAAGQTDWGTSALYQVAPGAEEPAGLTWCFPEPDAETPNGRVVSWQDGDRTITLLGSAEPLVNDDVDEPGNAALALQLLGAHPDLVWWTVDPLDPGLVGGTRPSIAELLPPWVSQVAWWFVLVAVLAVLWQGRRMGRLVPEPLPVVVRSVETARGRAALYRESGARDRAALVLRADAVRRLALRLGLPASTPAAEVVAQAVARSGPQGPWVRGVLDGPPPADDRQLTHLADALDRVVGDRPETPPTARPTTDRKAPVP